MQTLGVAVVGVGFIGPVHVEAVRRLGHRVVGILGSQPEKSIAAATALQLPRGYGSLSELLTDPQVQVVHLASPNSAHYEQCLAVLAAGKHLVCEKPLAMTTRETAHLVELAANTNLITAVNYNVRFYPMVLEARDRVRRGGRVLHLTGSYLQDWLLTPTDYNWRVDAERGGELRAVADIGTHWLDTLLFITGLEVESVCADLATVHPVRYRPTGPTDTFSSNAATDASVPVPITTEDYGSILLKFHGGARGCLTVSQVCAGRKNCIRFDIAATDSSYTWNAEEPNTLWQLKRDGPSQLVPRDPGTLCDTAKPYSAYPAGHAEGFPDTFKQLYRAVYADILAGSRSAAPLYATFADGHRELVLCEAILQSHREQRWVTLPPSPTTFG